MRKQQRQGKKKDIPIALVGGLLDQHSTFHYWAIAIFLSLQRGAVLLIFLYVH